MKLLSVIALALLSLSLLPSVQASEGGLRRRRHSHQQLDGTLPVGLQKLRQRRQKLQGKLLQEHQEQAQRETTETATGAEKETRVIGGQDAPSGKYPFMADFDLGCGASLISSNMLLTAAHCLELVKASQNAYIGSNQLMKGMKREIERVIVHPSYDTKSTAYDFLLVKLKDPVTTIDPVSLNSDASVPGLQTISKTNSAQQNGNASTRQVVGELMTVIGFGVTREGDTSVSNTLQEAKVPYVPHETCRKWYKNEELDEGSMFCGGFEEGGVDSCQGDSGAPILSSSGVQLGVVSWGQGCARAKSPGVYSRVSTVLPWIYEMLCEHSPQKPSSYCIGSRDTANGIAGNSGNNQSSNNNNNGNNNGSSAANPPPSQVNPKETGHTLQLDIKYDANPKQTAWVLVDSSNNKVLDSITYGDATIPNQELTIRYENQPSGNYTFLISDSAGNGLTNTEEGRGSGGNGYVTISEILEDGTSHVLWANSGDFGPGTYQTFELPSEDASSSTSRAAAAPEKANGWV